MKPSSVEPGGDKEKKRRSLMRYSDTRVNVYLLVKSDFIRVTVHIAMIASGCNQVLLSNNTGCPDLN